jgi:predicted ATPase/DNA-binding CsgD family transcriptional regulator
VQLTSFVGRRREVTDVKRVLAASRLVTLTGPGGVGKTRLALKVAADVRRAFGDGVWLVELDQLRDPALVSHTVAAWLGLREQSGRPPMAVLAEYLAQRRLLLVLDNCEHLVDAVAVLADTLLRSCPQLRILATSREPLGIGGETTLPVPSLSVPDPRRRRSSPNEQPPNELSRCEAVTLFAERAASVVPGFSIAEDNRLAVVEICHRLDGLPLAIELAAVRLRALTAQEIAHRLGDRYRLLTTGQRGVPTRQQTLRSCIQWSYDLCSPPEQLLWARLAVFAGSVDLDAAEGVCAGDDLAPENMLEVVASLVDKSILIPEQGPVVRYRLLDTIREFGRERLHQTGEYQALRRRHRDWYADFVTRADADWIGPRQRDWLTWLDREHPNIRATLEFSITEPGEARAALRIATKLFPYWLARGLLSEGRHWLDQALACDTGLTAERSRALHRASTLAGLQGDLAAASALAEQGRELAAQLGDAAARTQAMLASGYLGCMRGDLPGAVACFEQVLDTLGVEGDVHWQLEARYGLALASGMHGDTARTGTCHEEILAITEPHSELWYRSHSLWNLGVVAWRQGDPRRAAELVEQSLRLKQAMDDTFGAVLCLDTLAWIAASEHDPRRAATLLGAAAALTQAMGTLTITYTYPGLAAHHEQCERQTRRTLGEQVFQAAYQHGMGLAFDDAIAYALKDQPRAEPSPASTETTTLTRRQREVVDLVADGLTNKEIAARLVISPRTAEVHVDHILTKLGFTSRTQIAAWAIQQPSTAQDRRP